MLPEMFRAWSSFYPICGWDEMVRILHFAAFVRTDADTDRSDIFL